MRILFIYYDTASSEPPKPSYGVAYLSGFLKHHGHSTSLCYIRTSQDMEEVLARIVSYQPALVAHSSTSSSFSSARQLITRIGNVHPDLFQICGGTHVSLVPTELDNLPALSAICRGYGEHPLLELATRLESGCSYSDILNLNVRHNGQIICNDLRAFPDNLDDFIPCDRELFYCELSKFPQIVPFSGKLGTSYHEFIFCRGCPFDCTFCCNHAIKKLGHGKFIQYPSVDKCIAELQMVRDNYGMTGAAFHDDILTLNKSWFKEFATKYQQQIGLPYVCNLRVGTFDKAQVELLQASGCRYAIVGIESGNDYIRNQIMHKQLKSHDIIAAFKLLHSYGIQTYSQNMIGLPEETAEHFLDTVKINAAILPNGPTLSIFYPYPGTVLYQKCTDEALFAADIDRTTFHERTDSILQLPGFSRPEVLFLAKNFEQLIRYHHIVEKHPLARRMLPVTAKRYPLILKLLGLLKLHRPHLYQRWGFNQPLRKIKDS